MPSLSVCMILQNSEKTLPIALESLDNVYDELIIVDGGSIDYSCDIADKYKAKIIHSKWTGDYSHQRNIFLSHVKTDWVFVLDSDEFINLETLNFIKYLKEKSIKKIDNFWIPRRWISPFNRKHYIVSYPHYPDSQRRLFRYYEGISYHGHVHEMPQGFTDRGKTLVDLSIYHLDLFINNEEKRRSKVRHYSQIDPRNGARHFYLPDTKNIQTLEWSYDEVSLSVQLLIDKLLNESISDSRLNNLIFPEIKNDDFYNIIQEIARKEDIKTILEIGSSSGEGSTEALVKGIRENANKPILFCMEVSQTRFSELKKNYANDSFVKCYNFSSVALENFPDSNKVSNFYNTTKTNLNYYRLEEILDWLKEDIEYLKKSGVAQNGIQKIKEQNNIEYFDVVLIDGSEFTGLSELDEVYGAKYILLDDINAFKNYHSHQKLLKDKNYELVTQNFYLYNGYSVFQRVNNDQIKPKEKTRDNSILPIHFFTIVLNGEPFIRYHIEAFKQLPFKWHWHIVEGVAELKHDTGWSIEHGGHISDQIHHNGRSNDGTTEYLDQLVSQYPEQIRVYRQPEGVFWNGKREMVNEPLFNINEECLLWQVDVDELWTVEQICIARQLFIDNPDKTAAFYWCWYFVGENLIISTRNCYSQNPQQEWLRTWRYKPGAVWVAHEPPRLEEPLPNGQWQNVAALNPFRHDETEKYNLVFQHFAYVTPEQLKFKEQYYGYTNASAEWKILQKQTKFPVLLRQYFSWVGDDTMVDKAESYGIVPIAQKLSNNDKWFFLSPDKTQIKIPDMTKIKPIIIVDGVFFQLYKTGIARVWKSLLEEWLDNGFAKYIVVIDRAGTAPKIPGIQYRTVELYDYNNTDSDRQMLQQVCDEEDASLFISTYYTTPTTTPSVFLAHDMIPELFGWNLNNAMWREKHYGIKHASAYIAVSENTARDLVKCFSYIPFKSVIIAQNGVNHKIFSPAQPEELNAFKTKYGIAKPYFILVGAGNGYKNSILFFEAFSQLASSYGFDIVSTGIGGLADLDFRAYTSGSIVHILQLSDEELAIAYSGAVALIYPSKYEGFGLPVLEAIACGCPVITCPNASIPEVAGKAALYVQDDDIEEMANALCEVQKPSVRNPLIAAGLKQAKQFSWSKMAKEISSVLIDTTLLPLNLRETNLIVFPDWSQPEELLGLELQQIISAIAAHPDSDRTTLLIDTSNISLEDAELLLSGVTMNLLMEENLDVSEGLEISLIRDLADIQWEALLPRIQARIVLQDENKEALAQAKADNLLFYDLENKLLSEDICNYQLEIENNQQTINQLHTEALALYHNRQFVEAEEKFNKVLELDNNHASAWLNLGTLYYTTARNQEALNALKKCLQIEPLGAIQHYTLGLVQEKLGAIAQAIKAYKQAIALDVNWIDAYNRLGNIFLEKGDLKQAELIYRQAIAAKPNHFGSYLNLGNVLLENNEIDEAIIAYEKALELKPRHPDILYNMGAAFEAKNDFAEAALNYGYAFYRQGKYQEAVEEYHKFLEKKIGDIHLYLSLATCYQKLNQYEGTINTYEEAIRVYPNSANLYFQYALTLQVFGRTKKAIAIASQASQLLPDVLALKLESQRMLPIIYENKDEIYFYRQRFIHGLQELIEQTSLDTAEAKKSALETIGSRTNFYLQYQGKNDLELQKQYGEFAQKVMSANYPEWVKPLSKPVVSQNQKIRVGYVSNCMRGHTVGKLMLGWLRNCNRQEFEIYCYYTDAKVDPLTQQFRLYSDIFHHIPEDMEAVCKQIAADEIHVLVILDIGMHPEMTQIAGLRLAPVQCTTWGHPITSGIPTIDYFLSCELMEPDNAQQHYCEKLICLPNIGISYKKPNIPKPKKPRSEFGLKEEAVVYLSCQSLFKYLPQYDYIFPAIAQKVSQAQFVFISHGSDYITEIFRQRLQVAFAEFGLKSEEYCVILPRIGWDDYCNLNCVSDIFLDTFLWSGGNTTLEAIACNLPIVTCPGEFMRGRHSYGILQMLGVTDTIAKTEAEYIDIATKLGLDQKWRNSIVEQMVERHSYLYDDKTCIEALEEFYRRVIRED
ncbi:group 1 glycosyl transferase [Tolypothrix sp. NIES-4075]|uniref:tetratricopeptide repeat protein n=1 Tax=Tolypothrix sp. NIES-4075 TaxID=2005459 RepID=UPI000B6B554E|nr:group 1 glycosyl transferase [Tolypothrix sp. NIES-4075]